MKKYSFFASIPAGIDMGLDKISSYLKQFKLFKNPGSDQVARRFCFYRECFPQRVGGTRSESDGFLVADSRSNELVAYSGFRRGHVMFLLYEVITRRKPNEKFMENAQIGGMFFLIFLLLFANINDILKLVGFY